MPREAPAKEQEPPAKEMDAGADVTDASATQTEAPGRTIVKWDARQASQVGPGPMRPLTLLLESFARNLSSALGAYLSVTIESALVSAEHVTYRKFLQRLPELTFMGSCLVTPFDVNAVLQLDLSIVFPLIDVLLGGEGKGTVEPREVTEIEEQVLGSVMQMVCRELGVAWQALGAEFRFDRAQQKVNAPRLMLPEDKVLALNFNLALAETRGALQIAVPAAVSTALFRKVSAESTYRKPEAPAAWKKQMKARLLECSFCAELNVLGIRVPAKEVVDLKPGSLIAFDYPADSSAAVLVAGRPLFYASVMRQGQKRVARVTGTIPEIRSNGKEAS